MPRLVDWNGDGLLDLVVGLSNDGYLPDGDAPGVMHLFKNTGTAAQYRFHHAGTISTAAGVVISSASYMQSAIGDIDNDGRFDIVVADNGFKVYKNTGTAGAPQFADPVMIHTTDNTVFINPALTRFSIADWNGDGFNDLLIAIQENSRAKVMVYLAKGSDITGVSTGDLAKTTNTISFNPELKVLSVPYSDASGSMSIIALSGKTISTRNIAAGQTAISLAHDLSAQAPGCFLLIVTRNNIREHKQLIVQEY